MSTKWPKILLGRILSPISRPEPVLATRTYNILGARWYAKGLYVKEKKQGSEIQAQFVYRVVKGDFVYNRLFAWKGSFALASESDDGCYVSNEFPCFEIDHSQVVPSFLSYYFTQESLWNEALGVSVGGTPTSRNRLKEDKFLAMELRLPHLGEQQRIAARIDEVNHHICQAQALRRETREEAEALIVSIHTQLSHQRTRKIGELLKLEEDEVPISLEGSYPQAGLRSFGVGLFPKPPVAGTATTYRSYNRLYAGAIVLSQVKGWEGAVAVCPSELEGWFVSPEYRTFRCISGEALPDYMSTLVRTEWFWSKLKHATRGVGARRERTRPEQFLNIKLPMPNVDEQERGAALFAEVSRLKDLQDETTSELDLLLPSVVSHAFSGVLQ